MVDPRFNSSGKWEKNTHKESLGPVVAGVCILTISSCRPSKVQVLPFWPCGGMLNFQDKMAFSFSLAVLACTCLIHVVKESLPILSLVRHC